jgi:hypothetical protein
VDGGLRDGGLQGGGLRGGGWVAFVAVLMTCLAFSFETRPGRVTGFAEMTFLRGGISCDGMMYIEVYKGYRELKALEDRMGKDNDELKEDGILDEG